MHFSTIHKNLSFICETFLLQNIHLRIKGKLTNMLVLRKFYIYIYIYIYIYSVNEHIFFSVKRK
ncbi:hypothetical protein K7X86_00165, partial [Candidatus Sulcia muelleri]|nr:hypothetical protein [Candidatus Karelsulcia muelleri]